MLEQMPLKFEAAVFFVIRTMTSAKKIFQRKNRKKWELEVISKVRMKNKIYEYYYIEFCFFF